MSDAAARRRLRLLPPAVVATTAASWWSYNHSPPAIATIAIAPYALCLVLGPVLVYPNVRAGGGSWQLACGLALVTPLLWLCKELYRVTAIFSPAEAAYFAFNPISFGLFAGAATQMAIAELVLRRLQRGSWRPWGGPGLTLAFIGLLAVGAGAIGATSGGREIFYGYIALYRLLFPSG